MDAFLTSEVLGLFRFVVCQDSPICFSKDDQKSYCIERDKMEEANCGDMETTSKDPKQFNDSGSIVSSVCELCGKCFRTRKLYLMHVYQSHTIKSIEKSFKCKKCPKSFQQNYLLSKHINVIHSDFIFQCNKCTSTFKSKQSLQRHYRMKHKD